MGVRLITGEDWSVTSRGNHHNEVIMFGLLKSVGTLVGNVAEVALTPVEVAVDLVNAASEPFVEAAKEIKKDVKDLTK